MALPVLTGATLCLDANTGVTADSSNRVSAWADRYAVINNFTQSTDANKPLLSRSDNQENQLNYSDQLDNAYWTKTLSSVLANQVANPFDGTITVDLLREDTNNALHHINRNFTVVSGQTYAFEVYAKREVRDLALSLTSTGFSGQTVYFNVSTGSIISASGTIVGQSITPETDGFFRCTMVVTATATGTGQLRIYTCVANSTNVSYLGDGASGVYIARINIRANNTNILSLPTTDYAQYAGVNGNRTLVFNGAQELTTTSTLANLFTASDGIVYAVVRPFITLLAQIISRSSTSGRKSLYIDSNTFQHYNNDGVQDIASSPTISANNLYIARIRHVGGFIYSAFDIGAGFQEGLPVASGNTDNMTYTYSVGSGSSGLYGQLLTLQADNVGTPDTTFETELRSALFGTAPTASTTNLFFCYPQLPIQSTVTADDPLTGFSKAENIGAGDRAEHYRVETERATTNIDYDLGSGVLDKPEYFIVARADYLSRGDSGTPTITLKGSVNSGYTATEDLSINVNSSTLVGLRNEDVILETSFGASYRYFRLTLATTTSFYHEISKVYFGDFFDLGRDPLYLSEFKLLKKQQDNKKHKRVYNLIYDGITEAKREAFNETILKNADIYPIYLYDKNDLFFEGKKLLHCWITEHKWDIGYFKSKLTLELTEVF